MNEFGCKSKSSIVIFISFESIQFSYLNVNVIGNLNVNVIRKLKRKDKITKSGMQQFYRIESIRTSVLFNEFMWKSK